MSMHQETGHGPALSMAEAIAKGNSANGDVVGINGGTNGSAIGGINGFAHSETHDSGIPATNGYGHGSRDQNVNGEGDALEEPAESFASERKFDQASYEPIAIIGCGMRLPGAIDTDEALWQLLSGKQDGRCRVPLDRYNVDAFYGPGKAGHVCTEFGHFLEHVNLAEIDSSFWSMTRKEIEVMDPQQRLALEVVYECLQSSGTTDWKGKKIGVFFGIYGEDWADMQAKESHQSGMYRITGYGDFVVANRVSYEFGFKGPSVVTRTACSSSLTALHDACLAVQRGECESAIAGGTNLIMNPHMTIAMTEQGVLSVDGACKTFDSAANGYVRGEGVVAVQVKSLSAAIRDNDPIRAIIRSSCTNSDGRTAGLALPNSESHEALMRRSHKLADLDVRHTAMIECHGTGTQVGDPLEASAVARVFGDYGIYIGSIKPNLGHSEGASGITSVIKAMISLEKRLILPNINFHNPNKKIPFDEYNISVPTETLQWPSGKAERIGVNSFGIGGANAHVLLESPTEYGLARPKPSDQTLQSYYLLTFSAASTETLEKTVKAHEAYYQQHPDRLADLSYTLTVRRQPLQYRAFCVVPTGTEPGTPLQVSPFESSGEPRLATFVFTGQGAQYAQMAADLLHTNRVFQASVDSMEKILAKCNHPPTWSLREELLKTPEETNLALAEYSQPCCTAVQVALVDVLRSWGVEPIAVVGHSSGEIGAAYACGVLSAADAIKAAYYRGIVSKNIETDGGMAAVGLSRIQVKPHLRQGVIIGCENSPSSVTLSGDSDALQQVMASIREQYPEALVRKLRVDCAYHSHHMKPVSSTYAELLSSIEAKRPGIPFYSSVTGERVDAAALDASYWVSNLLSPVLFHPAVSRLLSDLPDAVLLEVGPHSALAGPLRQTVKATNSAKAEYVGTLVRNKNASAAMLSSMGSLFQRGVPVRFERVVAKGNVLTDLPRYAWHRQGPYWTESRLSQGWRQREFPKHDILGARVVEASEYDPTWRCLLKLDDVPWIRDHDISHDIVFPGAGYVAMAGEAIRQLTGEIDFTVREVTISNALVFLEGATTEVITHLKPVRLTTTLDSTWYDFDIASYNSSSGRWIKHAVGQARGGCSYEINLPEIAPEKRVVGSPKWYSVMKRFGLNYGPRFQGMREITAGISKRRAVAYIDNISEDSESFYTMHPCTIDFAFQLFSVAAFKGLSRLFTQLSVPTYIGELYIRPTAAEIFIAADAEVTPRGAFFGDAVGVSPDVGTVFRLKNLKLSPLTDASDVRGNDPHAAVELVWKSDINQLDPMNLMHVTKHSGHLSLIVERMALACIVESSLLLAERDIKDEFLLKFRAWLDKVYQAALKGDYDPVEDDSHIARMSSTDRRSLIESVHQECLQTDAWSISTAIYKIFHAIEGIFAGTTEALQVLVEDDLLARVYDFGRLSNFDEFFTLVAHQKPNLRILEVGAGTGGTTAEVLPALSRLKPYDDRNYLSYAFTDVSPGFFGSAKERFKDYEAMEYRVLDISKDPLDQGLAEGSFDLIVASNVLHATPDLVQTLTNCRKLLTAEGWLFLQELSPPTKWINYVMGVLPGWWLGESDGRAEEPYLSPPQWEPYLRAAGFEGVQSVHHDGQFNATMVSRPTMTPVAKRVTILAKNLALNYVGEISSQLQSEGYQIDRCAWGEKCPAGQDIVALLDLDAPFVHSIDEAQYSQFKDFLLASKENGNGILWITGSAQNNCSDPRYGIFLGFARTLRTEHEVNLGTLELDKFEVSAWKAIAKVLPQFQRRASAEGSSRKPDIEWAFVNDEILTPRFHWTSVNEALTESKSDGQARKLDVGKRGILNSLYWKQYTPSEPQGDYIRVRNYAVGLNFKDVLISMGIVEGTVVEGDGLGCESAGIVEKVGPEVKDLTVGDRCIVFASGAFATSLTTSEKVCVKIPDSLSFTDAASMATVYCTVIYSVIDKARLEKGQTILIHSACGGVGIAGIQVCRALGAEIYCTVGSEEKVQWLLENYHIPRDHIFNSRDQTFQRDVLEATGGRGVDVVLNSLSGELLHASWQCVAEFGCMVEIGKRDLIGKGSLALDLFERNRSYFGVDFAQICGERPEIASRLLKKMMEFFNRGEIGPIHPITHFEGSQIEDSMRFMQKGSHIGKVVVSLPERNELPTRTGKEVFKLRPNASYLLVGGLGGLGQAIAVWMAEAGATELIFLSRSAGAADTYSSFVAELDALGCKAIMIQGSVVKEADVEKSMLAATKPLAGILQASMVLHDVAFPVMSFDDWQTVTQPKVQGTWNLHNVSVNLGLDLDFFLLFSSWSGLVGQWGQANYAAGNSFLDSFAQYRRNMGLPASTVDIGIMEDIGYVSRNAHVLEHFRTTSTHVLYEQDLLDSLHLMIKRGAPASSEKCQLAIGLRSTQLLSAPNNRTVWRNDPRMALYFNTESQSGTTTSTGNDELRQFLTEVAADSSILDSEESITYIATEIGNTLFGFLMRDVNSLDVRESFSALGVDSLVSIELRNWFKQRLGCEITVLDILGSSSILALGEHTALLLKSRFMNGS